MDITRETIDRLITLAEPNISEHGGFAYSDKPLHRILPPTHAVLEVETLQSIATLVVAELLKHGGKTPILVVHVKSPNTVTVHTGLKEDLSRDEVYKATACTASFPFGKYLDLEEMVIAVKSRFVHTPDRDYVIEVLGNITNTNEVSMLDNGITQQVTVKRTASSGMVDSRAVRPIVTLAPFRTFLEVDQPESEFLLRINKDGKAALFEADGGMWRLEAQRHIHDWLAIQLSAPIGTGAVVLTR